MPGKFGKVAIFIALLTLAVVAQPERAILGSWVQETDNARWTFRADGTGMMERGKPRTTARFNWQVQGNTLQLSTAGTSILYQVIQCDAQKLVIKNQRVAQVYQLRREG